MRAQYWITLRTKEYACCVQSERSPLNREGFLVYNFHFRARVHNFHILLTKLLLLHLIDVTVQRLKKILTRGLNIKQSFNELETGNTHYVGWRNHRRLAQTFVGDCEERALFVSALLDDKQKKNRFQIFNIHDW